MNISIRRINEGQKILMNMSEKRKVKVTERVRGRGGIGRERMGQREGE